MPPAGFHRGFASQALAVETGQKPSSTYQRRARDGSRKDAAMTNRPALLIDSIGLRELVAAVNAAQAALDVALAREYAGECALHDAHQAARTAPPQQLRQADAWCAAAGDKLHSAIVEVKRATEQLVIAQTSLSQATGSGRRSA
jgi:hypothetical protein